MRRFTAVFSSKRDKNDLAVVAHSQPPPPATSARQKSLKRTLVSPTTPALSSTPSTPQLSDPTHSSSGSSTGSASLSLQTPDDEHVVVARNPTIKSWRSWLGGNKSAPTKHVKPNDWDKQISPEWQSRPPPRLRPPPSGNRAKTTEPSSDLDTSSDEYDESLSASLPHHHNTTSTVVTPSSLAHAQRWLHFFTHNSLTPLPTTSSPFAHQTSTLSFPRSCHSTPPRRQTMESSLHKRLLLKRLESFTQPLTRAEELSIAPYSTHAIPEFVARSPASIDESMPHRLTKISPSSPGVQRWISRPCFEDRFDEFIPIDGNVTRRRVTGTAFAVAALEYPELLDLMAGFEFDTPSAFIPGDPQAMKEADSPITLPPPVAVHARNIPYIAVPSPLRNEHAPGVITSASSGSEGGPVIPQPQPQAAEAVPPVKRGVRFVEDDKDDVIPIGYVLRTKKRREEKARFLREEQERRAFEEERARVEEERRKMDLQRSEWEAERRAWEKEKRIVEEERKQRLYAEEVAAARLRRESQRVGGVPSSGSHSGGASLLPPSSSTTSLRDLERNKARDSSSSNRYARPVYDPPHMPRREASEPSIPTHAAAASNSNSPHSSSPASSRPPSIAGQSPIPGGSGRNSSQVRSGPPSVYSSSSEDIRSAGKRSSMASQSYSSHRNTYLQERTLAYPLLWTGSGPVPGPLPSAMPGFVMMDMPLLPPTPPFMLHQYPRQRSLSSQRQNQFSTGSTERLPQQQQGAPSSTHRPSYHSTPPAPPSSSSHNRQSMHQRRPSGDGSRRASAPQTWTYDKGKPQGAPSSTNSHGTPVRGRSSTTGIVPQPAPPNPWTALPTHHGKPPTSMPLHSQTVSPAYRGSSRRQTFTLS